MQHFTTTWQSEDRLDLFAQVWEPEGEPKAVICLVHGLGEHSGRYGHVAQVLTDGGYAVLSYDLRGHGRSDGTRGHFSNHQVVLSDLDRLLGEAAKHYPGKPRFFYGHSLGAILALYYTLMRKPDLRGVICTGPGLRTALHNQKGKIWLSRLLKSIWPSLTIPSGLDPAGISRDPAVVQAYRADPLVHGVATPGFANFVLEAIEDIFAQAADFPVPLLIMHGSDDPLAYASGSRDFAAIAGSNCTLKLWDGLLHEIHNEVERFIVLAYAVDWLDRQMSVQ